ncbi:hypothetical protein [Neobacillus kokaensis]|uniref:Peptidase n=1 Tax=Neobacillus kokaensis TaxID=2759023 RepID=A0ABQ3N985_9BACI|nr:hypothetical protein [Neobacillus kokaensis]GHI00228.1 hypothetical protein AM1BK_37700 [Neobacillus kokaensis]
MQLLNSSFSLIPLEIRKDKKHYIVEDKTSGEFYEMPEVCVIAIELMSKGITLGEIENQIKGKYPLEEVDMLDFAEQLLELQLVAEIDGVKVEICKKENQSLGYLWISPQFGKFFFNKTALLIYIILFFVNVSFFVTNPSLFPNFKDLFIFDYMFLNIPIWMFLSFVLVLVHEFGHVLAMRAYNLPTRLEIGHRLFFVVLETDMSLVWKLPSKNRNVLYLAGLCFDTVILFIALTCLFLFSNASGIYLSILHVIVLDTFIRMVYQCCIYMKTDLYYLFENVSGSYNLMENAQQQINSFVPFVKSAAQEEVIFAEEKRTVLLYTIFYFIGIGFTLYLFVCYYIPQLLFALKKIMPGFFQGTATLPFWDAVIFTLQLLIGLLLLLYSWRKKYLQMQM